MKKNLPLAFFFGASILITSICFAQQNDRFAYAITDVQKGTNNWSALRKLNLQTGEYSDVLLNGTDISILANDAASKKQFSKPVTDARFGQLANAAFGTGVAAMAYDKKHNRLYYSPMFIDQLRYIDLKTMKVFFATDHSFTGKAEKAADQSNIITRMTIGDDGNGYAMTNDGNQLIQFSTGKKLTITNLGTVVDDPANKNISIHNSCSSYGGDMVADDDGNLYVFSARNQVFKVNINTKIATYLGAVSGLPKGFTINGAAVTNENKIIVGTASPAIAYFTVDHKTLIATPYTIAGTTWNSSDLANSNLLATAAKNTNIVTEVIGRNTPANSGDGKVSIFPNPVTNHQFAIQFNQLEAGAYTIQVTDVMGRQLMQQITNLSGENQLQSIKLDPSSAKGIYLVKVTDMNSRSIFSSKLIIQ